MNKVDFESMSMEFVMECTGQFLIVKRLKPYFDVCGIKQVFVLTIVKDKIALKVVLECNHDTAINLII